MTSNENKLDSHSQHEGWSVVLEEEAAVEKDDEDNFVGMENIVIEKAVLLENIQMLSQEEDPELDDDILTDEEEGDANDGQELESRGFRRRLICALKRTYREKKGDAIRVQKLLTEKHENMFQKSSDYCIGVEFFTNLCGAGHRCPRLSDTICDGEESQCDICNRRIHTDCGAPYEETTIQEMSLLGDMYSKMDTNRSGGRQKEGSRKKKRTNPVNGIVCRRCCSEKLCEFGPFDWAEHIARFGARITHTPKRPWDLFASGERDGFMVVQATARISSWIGAEIEGEDLGTRQSSVDGRWFCDRLYFAMCRLFLEIPEKTLLWFGRTTYWVSSTSSVEALDGDERESAQKRRKDKEGMRYLNPILLAAGIESNRLLPPHLLAFARLMYWMQEGEIFPPKRGESVTMQYRLLAKNRAKTLMVHPCFFLWAMHDSLALVEGMEDAGNLWEFPVHFGRRWSKKESLCVLSACAGHSMEGMYWHNQESDTVYLPCVTDGYGNTRDPSEELDKNLYHSLLFPVCVCDGSHSFLIIVQNGSTNRRVGKSRVYVYYFSESQTKVESVFRKKCVKMVIDFMTVYTRRSCGLRGNGYFNYEMEEVWFRDMKKDVSDPVAATCIVMWMCTFLERPPTLEDLQIRREFRTNTLWNFRVWLLGSMIKDRLWLPENGEALVETARRVGKW